MQALGWFTVFPWMRAVELLTAGIDTWHDGGDYTLLDCILWMFGDFFLYMFAAWYTDKVFPGEYGIKYPPYFLFSKNYWCPPPALPPPPPSATDPEAAGGGGGGTADGSFEESRDASAVIQVQPSNSNHQPSTPHCAAGEKPCQSVPQEPAQGVAARQGAMFSARLRTRLRVTCDV